MHPALRFVARFLALALLAPAAVAQTALDIPDAKRLAYELIALGQPESALAVLRPLRARDPDDAVILIGLSRAERSLGNLDVAARLGRNAWAAADTRLEKFQAARVTAQALAAADKRTRAQIWLRRAGANAPDPRAEEQVRREYAYVRRRNPLAFTFDLSVTPSDNVNNAPTSNRLTIGDVSGIDPTAVPIGGVETWLTLGASYRLPPTATRVTQFALGYTGKRVHLGNDAARIDPDLRASELSYDRVQLGWSGRFRSRPETAVTDTSVTLFRDDQGGDHLQNGVRLGLGRSFQPAPAHRLRLGWTFEALDRRDVPVRTSQAHHVTLDWSLVLAGRDRLDVHLGLAGIDSDSALIARNEARIRTSYSFGKPVLGAQITLSADWRRSSYDRAFSEFFPRRSDDRIGLMVSATLFDQQAYGFAPVIELRHERNRSNIASFDTRSTSIGISLRSTY